MHFRGSEMHLSFLLHLYYDCTPYGQKKVPPFYDCNKKVRPFYDCTKNPKGAVLGGIVIAILAPQKKVVMIPTFFPFFFRKNIFFLWKNGVCYHAISIPLHPKNMLRCCFFGHTAHFITPYRPTTGRRPLSRSTGTPPAKVAQAVATRHL